MAGIYIHVPFCYKRCYYCDFYSSVNTKLANNFIEAASKEIEEKSGFFQHFPVEEQQIRTIYFGGGTPSLLTLDQIETVLLKIRSNFSVSRNAEITLEANPDDLNFEYLAGIKNLGINRLSIGIQSFEDDMLRFINRRHDAQQAINSVKIAQQSGFDNISIDLIYGLPGLSNEDWKTNLEKAFGLKVQHLSAYHLGIEKGTVFGKWLEKGKIKEINEEDSWYQFELLHMEAHKHGFEHYEISNLSMPGKRSQHNTSYWNSIPYLGVGPSAHSFNGSHRFWNKANVSLYIQALNNHSQYTESEKLTLENEQHEFIMTQLRTCEGIDLNQYERKFGEKSCQNLKLAAQEFAKNGYAEMDNSCLKLNLKGWFISDRIISELI